MKYWFLDHPQQGQTQSLLEEHQKKLADFEADFISNVSHEMKTPLAVISNYTTLLQTSNLEHEERDKYLSIIQTQISKLSSMMTNILKLNKLEQRTYDLELKEISISEFVCQCILSFEHIWQEKNITIETDLQEPLLFVTDQQLLELVLNNLLSNAFKFTDHGGLVSVTCYRQDHELVIQVRDTGCGISDQTGRHIFERFYQGDTSHKTEGNGLGLALVRQIIDVLTGEISVRSQLGKGTTFCTHLKELC
jgi:signal transduction histidine kinase